MRTQLNAAAIGLLVSIAPLTAQAACASPPTLADETKKVDTEGAIGRFMQLAGLNFRVNVVNEKKAVFTAFPNSDQMIVALTLIYNFCSLLAESKDMTTAQKIMAQMEFQNEILTRATGPRPVQTTAPPRSDPVPSPQQQLDGERRSDWLLETPVVQLAAVKTAQPVGERRKPSWADIYLNPNPLVITDQNKYFVIVGSAPNDAQGVAKMKALKAKHPDYDFELYGPYGSNPSYGIMIASWVSRERAAEALQAAKKIEPTSFIWSCRGTGDAC